MQTTKHELKYRAYTFSIRLVKFVSTLPSERVYWVIVDQLTRAGTSIGANIIEAQAASSRRDFIRFFQIALKSANETKYWFGILREISINQSRKEEITDMLQEVTELSNILGKSLLTLKSKN